MERALSDTLIAASQWLQAEEVPHALIGGLAASLRGQPRVTADVDLVIGVDVSTALNLLSKLGTTSFQPLFDRADEIVQRAFILPLRHRDTQIKVDMAIGLSGFEQQVISRATPLEIAGTSISVATAEDLLLMKLIAGRPQDDQDIRGIVTAQGALLDWPYCEQTAEKLSEVLGQDLMSRLRQLKQVR